MVREVASSALVSAGTLHKPLDLEAYRVALSDTSVLDGDSKTRFERQEYLGDAIVGLAVARYSFVHFPQCDEGFLSAMRSRLVSRPTLALFAKRLELDKFKAENTSQRRLADAFESFVGAFFVDVKLQYDDEGRAYAAASDFVVGVMKTFAPEFVGPDDARPDISNYKGALNNLCLKWAQDTPTYKEVFYVNGDPPTFVFEVLCPIYGVTARGKGNTKRTAQQLAAKHALLQLNNNIEAEQTKNDHDNTDIKQHPDKKHILAQKIIHAEKTNLVKPELAILHEHTGYNAENDTFFF